MVPTHNNMTKHMATSVLCHVGRRRGSMVIVAKSRDGIVDRVMRCSMTWWYGETGLHINMIRSHDVAINKQVT